MKDFPTMSEEWRVEVELTDEGHGLSLGERLRSMDLDDEARERLGGDVIVTRDGSRITGTPDSTFTVKAARAEVARPRSVRVAGRDFRGALAVSPDGGLLPAPSRAGFGVFS